MRIIFDASASASSRRVDENGFLHVSACPISSHGTFDYARVEAGLPGDPNELVKVLRPENAISTAEFIQSCQNLPLIDDHTYIEGVIQDAEIGDDEGGMDPSKKGVCGVLTNVRYDAESGWVVGDLAIYARQMIRQIQANKKTQLSLGYTCLFTPVEGEPYAATQTSMLGNHLALVDRARVPGARVLDSAFPNPSNEDDPMSKKTKARALDSSAVDKLRELLLPALQQFLSEEAGDPDAQDPAVDPAADPAADPALDTDPVADPAVDPAVEPAADPAAENGDADIVALLQQLLAALSPAADPDPAADPAVEPTADADPAADPDAVVGDDLDAPDQTAKPGVTMDAMFKAVAERDKLYGRVSRLTGTFDHAAMTADQVAKYGVKKLGLKCGDGQEVTALDAYLYGLEAGSKVQVQPTKAGDSVTSDELDAYLSGKK